MTEAVRSAAAIARLSAGIRRRRAGMSASAALLGAQLTLFGLSTAATIALSHRATVASFAAFARWNTVYVLAYAATETWSSMLLLDSRADPSTASGVRAVAVVRGGVVGLACLAGAAWGFDGPGFWWAGLLGLTAAVGTAWADVCRTDAIARSAVTGAAAADLAAAAVSAAVLLALLRTPTHGGLDFLIFFVGLIGSRAVAQSVVGGGTPGLRGLRSIRPALISVWRRNYPYTAVVTVARNVDNVVVSAIFGAMALGIYARAYSLLLAPVVQLSAAVAPLAWRQFLRATGPACDRIADRWIFVLAGPAYLLVLLATVGAPRLVPVLLGPQWVPAIAPMRLLSLCGAALVLQLPALWAAQTGDRGVRPWVFAVCELIPVTMLAAASPWGFGGALRAYTAASLTTTAALLVGGLGGGAGRRGVRLLAVLGLPLTAGAARLLGAG